MANQRREKQPRDPGREEERGTERTRRPGEEPERGGEPEMPRGGGRGVREEEPSAE